jgi:hypothetical protein
LVLAPLAIRARLLPALVGSLALVATLAGILAGHARLEALDSRALRAPPGTALEATGFLLAPPEPSLPGFHFPIETEQGRVEVSYPGDPGGSTGDRIYVSGRLAEPDPFDADRLERSGIAMQLEADKAERVPGARAGLAGGLDAIRRRGEAALQDGTSPGASALLLGFVLSEDSRIDSRVRDEFKRSGLAHILTVCTVAITAVTGHEARSGEDPGDARPRS